jgi:hypothetical protein
LLTAPLAAVAADEPPVRDPLRPYGSAAGASGSATARAAGPRFELTGVLISTARRVAIVNGKPYVQGESVDGAEIVAIESNAVRLRERGAELVVSLGRPAQDRPPITQGETVP